MCDKHPEPRNRAIARFWVAVWLLRHADVSDLLESIGISAMPHDQAGRPPRFASP